MSERRERKLSSVRGNRIIIGFDGRGGVLMSEIGGKGGAKGADGSDNPGIIRFKEASADKHVAALKAAFAGNAKKVGPTSYVPEGGNVKVTGSNGEWIIIVKGDLDFIEKNLAPKEEVKESAKSTYDSITDMKDAAEILIEEADSIIADAKEGKDVSTDVATLLMQTKQLLADLIKTHDGLKENLSQKSK